jgi:hypothetical protein
MADLVPVLPRRIPERVSTQVQNARLHSGPLPDAVIALGSPFRSSLTATQTSATPRFFRSVSTASQNFAPSLPSPGHNPRMSRSPLTVTPWFDRSRRGFGFRGRACRFAADAVAQHQEWQPEEPKRVIGAQLAVGDVDIEFLFETRHP